MYLVRDARRLGEPELDEGEHCEVVIVESAQLRSFTRDGTISHALVLLTLARALETLSNESEARFEAPRDLGSEP
jgi:hypothetical protein